MVAHVLDGRSRAVSSSDPDHLRRMAEQEAALMKISIPWKQSSLYAALHTPTRLRRTRYRVRRLGHGANRDTDLRVNERAARRDSGRTAVARRWGSGGWNGRELRSRSAANARHARMSSLFRSGKSARISCSDVVIGRILLSSWSADLLRKAGVVPEWQVIYSAQRAARSARTAARPSSQVGRICSGGSTKPWAPPGHLGRSSIV